MKHIMLKFNHGVEIGARLAYLGHYSRTHDFMVKFIASDELLHQCFLVDVLAQYGEKPSPVFDIPFTVIGNTISTLCSVSPKFMLDFVAKSMEIFAVFSYNRLAKMYPEHKELFLEMAKTEDEHREYFTRAAS